MIVKTKDLERSKASLTRVSNDMHVLQLFQEDGPSPLITSEKFYCNKYNEKE